MRAARQPTLDQRKGTRGAAMLSGLMSRLRSLALRLTGLALLIAVWQFATAALDVPTYLLPQPVVLAFGLVQDQAVILDGLRPLAFEATLGFLLGNGLGLALAITVDSVRWARGAVYPLALAIRSVPIVAITPLISLILGFGTQTTVAVATLISFFPMFVNMSRGLVAVDRQALELFEVLDAGTLKTYRALRWPSSLPYLYASLKVTASGAVLGAMIAEYIASNSGLGYMLQSAATTYQYRLMWEVTVVATALVIVIFFAVTWLERRLVPWAAPR